MPRLTDQERIAQLERRVAELEDALLYLSNTLRMNGLIEATEARVALRMYDTNKQLRPGGR